MRTADVGEYWSAHPCGSEWTSSDRYTRDYFDELERYRYIAEPMIPGFARFADARNLSILEVGIGAATDFVQWVRAGARAYGIDLTQVGVEHARRRLALEGRAAAGLSVANCERLPFDSDQFALVYSWGVIHHTGDTAKALSEIVRVCRPGGTCRVMIYHRRSLLAWYLWLRWALLSGAPSRTVSAVIHEHMESPGTQAFTRAEASDMVAQFAVTNVRIRTVLSRDDRLDLARWRPLRAIGRGLARVFGDAAGWFMLIEFEKLGQRS